jgi:hypothetical protein
MTYLPEDGQPSIFHLKEGPRQSILTIFNWTNNLRTHAVILPNLGLNGKGPYTVYDVLNKRQITLPELNSFVVTQPAHSVRVLKIIDTAVMVRAPVVRAQHPSSAKAGETVTFSARQVSKGTPVISYQWDFGDGVSIQGLHVNHAYTHVGNYQVKLAAKGLDGTTGEDRFVFQVTGPMSTKFSPARNRRYTSFHKGPFSGRG